MTDPSNPPPRKHQERSWRIIDLIQWGTRYFTEKEIANARLEIEWLLAHLLRIQRVDLYVQFEKPLTKAELGTFRGLVQRRVKGEPFQYIIGRAPFCGHDFYVTPAVLIPRPETEVIIQILQQGPPPNSILDIGTGSGCLAVTAALQYPVADVTAIDVSPDALDIAEENAQNLRATNVTFLQIDILKAIPEGFFDVVLCNPPYVARAELDTLQVEVRKYEPPEALTDGNDGLSFYWRLAEMGPCMLAEGGRLLVEIGDRPQEGPVRAIFEEQGWVVTIHPDLQGCPRVVEGRLAAQSA